MKFLYNNKEAEYPSGTTVRDLLNEKKIKKAAVWVNGEKLLKAQYDDFEIKEGDKVRLLRIQAGG
ncbi:MAG: sulfur carrier protein ThiS [Firmicutes bacterium]|nr:sulfur carrier protein ThiS [Bacillota bacterium]